MFGLKVLDSKHAYKLNSERDTYKDAVDRLITVVSKQSSELSHEFGLSSFLEKFIHKITSSKSQLFQDLFVLYCMNNKENGFFVEFGATDGYSLSNTYLLEKEYGWKGILAEPAKIWKPKLLKNRNCFIEDKCVWTKSGEIIQFIETDTAELSTIDLFVDADRHSQNRKGRKTYEVETISLNDLLKKYNAPAVIDYLSIDTEGSEFDILNSFNFSGYKINIITVEHNATEKREMIFDLLTSKGYKRVFQEITRYDDWYLEESLFNLLTHK